ncbi:MAG: hypothetical protein KAW89_03990 [Armatimonadetes bacterium]|nr:hypothetical protein [Armatimonadota bacterium]
MGVSTELIGLWVAALLTLAIYSFLYGDNPIYKFSEHIFVGVSAAYGAAIVYHQALVPKLVQPLSEGLIQPLLASDASGIVWTKATLVIPGILGVLIFGRFFRGYQWLSRWPIAFVMGLGAGLSIPRSIQSLVLMQMHGTMQPVWPLTGGGFDNLLLIVGVVCTLAYFYFSLPHRGVMGGMSRVGIWFLMIGFGAGFGNTVMARISLLIGRIQFLLYEWLPTIGIHLGAGPGAG